MILFDPDLDPDPPPAAQGKRASARAKSPSTEKLARVPSPRTLSRFLSDAQQAVRLRGQVNVLLTSDAGIRKLNRQFRGKNKATDVLSFPAMQMPGPKSKAASLAGDLAVSIPTARKQAATQGHALTIEIKVLILHGLLHLAGYDHETDEGQMARRERLLRGKLGLPQGLIERATRVKPGVARSAVGRNAGAGAPSLQTVSPSARVGNHKPKPSTAKRPTAAKGGRV